MSEKFSSWFPSNIAVSLFVILFILWAASEAFNRIGSLRQQFSPRSWHNDQGTYWILFLIIWGSLLLTFFSRWLNLGVFHSLLQYFGLLLVILGIVLREWAVLLLGRSFTEVVSVTPGQPLVQNGPYRWIRHPAYTGVILALVGFALALGTWATGLVILILCLVGFLYRIRLEEKVLLEFFGKEYEDYMQRTWRFFPGF
jgi:protein-S-isoprenylcysteine O-methyltransferase Ste14